jgi:GTP-binding protein SAR1
LFLGLDDAGKTTLLNLLKSNKLIQTHPSQHGTCEELILGNMKFTTYDLGGHKQSKKN